MVPQNPSCHALYEEILGVDGSLAAIHKVTDGRRSSDLKF